MVVKVEHYRQVNKAKKHPERNETTYKTTIRLMKVLIATGELGCYFHVVGEGK